MAIIGSIRKHPGLLVGAIAFSIVLFLIGGAVNDQWSVLGRGRKTDAGTVNGQNIPYTEYSNQVSEEVKNYESQNKVSLGDHDRNEISKQTWDDIVGKIVMSDACSKTGLAVSDDEMVALTTTENAHPIIRQYFGGVRFDPMYVKRFLQNISVDEKGQEPGAKRQFWNNLNKEVKKSELESKYMILVAKGVGNTPTWLAEDLYYETNKSADFKYIFLPYSEVNDKEIKYTDNDLKDYLSKNGAKFTTSEESRNIRYKAFSIAASSVDSAAILKTLTEKLDEFKKGQNKSDDSLFVKLYSETPFNDLYRTKDELSASPIGDSIFNLPVKSVIGPFVEGNMYKFAKVSARKMMSDSVKVKEIVFSYENIKTQAEFNTKVAIIDSLFKAIDSLHADFGAIAAQYSDDPASKNTGGVVGWVKRNNPQLDEYYKDLLFHNGTLGKTYLLRDEKNIPVKFVQVAEEGPGPQGVKVAYFTRTIIPSQETENNIYSTVNQFVSANSSEDKFKAYIAAHPQEIKTAVNIKKGSYEVMGLSSARILVKWVFEAKRGDISPILSLGASNDRKHVIAYLESVTGKGVPDLESVRERVKYLYLQDKKYELLAKKITDAKAGNIDALAAKLGKTIMEAEKVTFQRASLPTGREPAVAATAIYMAQGKLSAPVKGNTGVYVVQKTNGIDPPKPIDLTQQMKMLRQASYDKAKVAVEALKKLAKIDDNRLNFEGGN